jgi:hypothetical protein
VRNTFSLIAYYKAWVNQNRMEVVALYDNAEASFPYLTHLRDRTIDIVEPLTAILEVAYKEKPELEAQRLELLDAVSITRKDGAEFVGDHLLLQELAKLAQVTDPLIGSASELASLLPEPRPTEHMVSAMLRRYGFETKSVRQGDSIRYRYVVRRGELEDLCARYAEAVDHSIDLSDFYVEPEDEEEHAVM